MTDKIFHADQLPVTGMEIRSVAAGWHKNRQIAALAPEFCQNRLQ